MDSSKLVHSREEDPALKVEIREAPEGIEANVYTTGDTLVIELAGDLDEVTRQRYITQAKAEHGIESTRRRIAIPFLLPAGGIRHVSPKRQAVVAACAAVLVAGVAAAAIVPTAFDSDAGQRHPPAAAPAPRQTPPPQHAHPLVTPPDVDPSTDTPPPARSTPPPERTTPTERATSGKAPALEPSMPRPVRPPPVKAPPVKVAPTVPPRTPLHRVCLTVDLVTHIKVGCGRVLSRSRP